MRTPTKPWYRASKDAWYVEFNGRQVRLAKGRDNEKAARDAFYKLMANGSGKLPEADTLRVATVCDEGLLAVNPLRKVKKPPQTFRERVLSREERQEVMGAIRDQAFRDFVFAMQETGCRPSEVARVTAAHVNLELGVWVFADHKTVKKTGKPRIVYLTPAMIELTKRLMAGHPDGPLFRGPRGEKPFTRNGIRCRFKRLRQKLPHLKGLIAYAYRHSFATDALVNGVGIAQVAELLGHTSTEMVMRHYSHIAGKIDHMREAAMKAACAG